MRTKLWSLTLGNFAIGTGALIVPGMLNELTADLAVTPAAIGLLISAFAMTICLGAPFFASWTSAIERRKLLTGALVLYALTHLLAAVAPGYNSLLAVRIVTAVGAALFTAQAAATAGLMVPPNERGNAIGMVILGWSIAGVIGMPLGSYLGAHIGWRPTMALAGVLAGLVALLVWMQIPAKLFVVPMNAAAWKSLLTNRPVLLTISVTAIQGAAQFTVFAYIALLYKEFIGATPATISLLFACFGITGVVGNIIGARTMDRVGTVRVTQIAMAIMVLAFVLWPLSRGSLAVTIALTLLWGLGCFVVNGAQQTRLVDLAPMVSSASIALNSSAMYLGQAIGALAGGIIIEANGMAYLSIIGAVVMAAAIGISQIALRLTTRLGLTRST